MFDNSAYRCNCPSCQGPEAARTQEMHTLMRCLLSTLDARQQRLYAGLEASKRGQGGERLLALITGLSEQAIVEGQRELRQATLEELQKTSDENPPTINLIGGLGVQLADSKQSILPADFNLAKSKFLER